MLAMPSVFDEGQSDGGTDDDKSHDDLLISLEDCLISDVCHVRPI
jgi:hypothetical protein